MSEEIVLVYKRIKNLDRVSITRKGIIGVLHFNARNMKRVRKTGRWTQEEVQVATAIALEARNDLFPHYNKEA